MWSLEDEDGDLSAYFRLIEDEANELRKCFTFFHCGIFLNMIFA